MGLPAEAVVLGAAEGSQLEITRTSWGVSIAAGDLAYDQKKTFVVLLPGNAVTKEEEKEEKQQDSCALFAKLSYFDVFAGASTVESLPATSFSAASSAAIAELSLDIFRLATVDAVSTAVLARSSSRGDGLAVAQSSIRKVVLAIKEAAASASSTDPLNSLLTDVSGQITEAVSKADYYDKWGVHYLPAIARAHLLQVCTNFKVREKRKGDEKEGRGEGSFLFAVAQVLSQTLF